LELINISHLYKTYKTSNKNNDVLKDVSLTLPDNGLIVILGKSGCGKSTLLNLIGGIDTPSKGCIKYRHYGKVISKSKIKQNQISFIFQHYHLLENETLFYNVILPGLIQGLDKDQIEDSAKELLEKVGFNKETWKKEVNVLSGGEKARIAIIRALIVNPNIVLADEPTGALDEQNSIKIFDILKRTSKKKLVILVTHNQKMAEMYADRIITLQDGRVISDVEKKKIDSRPFEVQKRKVKQNEWIDHFVFKNFRKRFKRNFVSIIGMTLALCFSYLLIGFATNSQKSIDEISLKHFDYGSGVLNKEIKSSSIESKISLVKTIRPSLEDVDDIESKFPSFTVMNNYDCYFNTATIYDQDEELSNIEMAYVYNFDDLSIDKKLILNGSKYYTEKWNNVFINNKADEILKERKCSKPIFKLFYENRIVSKDEEIIDLLDVEIKLNVIGVVDEFDFLATPKIYFNYCAIEEFLANEALANASLYKDEEISWKSLVDNAEENSELSSYSYRIFLTKIENKGDVYALSRYLTGDIAFENSALDIAEALNSLTYAATMGLEIFLGICLSGSVMILGIFSFSAYNDDKKISSILTCLGAENFEIVFIFVAESLICSLFAFALSTILSIFVTNPLNILLEKYIGIPDLISIPFKRFLDKQFLLPILFFIGISFVGVLFTVVPILLSKSFSIKKELAEL